jgi:hypothetical protein
MVFSTDFYDLHSPWYYLHAETIKGNSIWSKYPKSHDIPGNGMFIRATVRTSNPANMPDVCLWPLAIN